MFDIDAYQRERHTDKLPTPELRATYAQTMIETMEMSVRVLQEAIEEFRKNPDAMLAHPFSPSITGMVPGTVGQMELTYGSKDGQPIMEIRGRTTVGDGPFNEVGFRVVWTEGNNLEPLEDNRF
jgi:hypothetical protein